MKHLLVGLILTGLGIWGIVSWWDVFGLCMRGVVPFSLLVLGLVAILAGYRRGTASAEPEAGQDGPLDLAGAPKGSRGGAA
jgi:hypothetical protein